VPGAPARPSTEAELAQGGSSALFGLAGLLLPSAQLAFESLNRSQKPGHFRLAV
jgi:hypothetical protein